MATMDFTLLKESFGFGTINGSEYIIPIAIIFLTILVITRDTSKWPILGFPVAVMWKIVALNVPWSIIALSAIICALSILNDVSDGKLVSWKGYSEAEEERLERKTKRLARRSKYMKATGVMPFITQSLARIRKEEKKQPKLDESGAKVTWRG